MLICRGAEDLQKARTIINDCPMFVVEKLIDVKKNYNIQFAVNYLGETIYLGSAEQIIESDGKYTGNWIDPEDQSPDNAIDVCRAVSRRAALMGYRGIAGYDTVLGEDGGVYIIDFNARENGSTPGLLLRDSILADTGAKLLKYRSWKTKLSTIDFISQIEPIVIQKKVVPLCIAIPDQIPGEDPTVFSALLPGSSKEEINELEKSMLNGGFE